MDQMLSTATDVLVTALAGFGFGALWYGKLGERWMAATGRTSEEIAADKSPTPFIIAGLAALLTAIVLRALFAALGLAGLVQGVALGAAIGWLVVAPWVVLHYAFAGRPLDLWWIDGLHSALALTLMGAALGFLA